MKKSHFGVKFPFRNFVSISFKFLLTKILILLIKKNNGVADQKNNSADHFTNSHKKSFDVRPLKRLV
jgi:hypothetical protein